MEKLRKLNLVMNEVTKDPNDPTKVNFSMIILDDSVSGNNVKVGENGMDNLAKSVKGMPLVTKLIENSMDRTKDDFGDHEASLGEDRDGNQFIERGTIAIGAFTSEGYVVTKEVDGVEVKCLMGDGVLWATRYPDIVNLITEMYDGGTKLNTSSEYRYSDFEFDENEVEIHDGEMYFEGIAVLGSATNYVAPAYESATFTLLNQEQKNQFNLLVAQAIEQGEKEKKPLKTKLNSISLYRIMEDAKHQIKEHIKDDYVYAWTTDATLDDIIIAVEDEDFNIKHYKYEYKIVDDKVVVDLDSGVEVREEREWKSVEHKSEEKLKDLETKVNALIEEKGALGEQLNKANEVISQLNASIDELTAEKEQLTITNQELAPFKEQVELANKEAKIAEASEAFEKKFNSVDGEKEFKSQEVQDLIMNTIVEGEVGINAKLALNEKIIELASSKLEKVANDPLSTVLNSTKQRDFSKIVTASQDEEMLKELV